MTAPRIEAVLAIDGHLVEPEWAFAQPAENFRQVWPQEEAPVSFGTKVRVLHDGRMLYISAWMYDSDPARIGKTHERRDNFNSADWFAIAIDVNGDG